MAYIKYQKAVENPIDCLGDVASELYIYKRVNLNLHYDQLHALEWESSLNNDPQNSEETI